MSTWTAVPSPIGEILLVRDEDALSGLYMGSAPRGADLGRRVDAGTAGDPLRDAADQLEAYFAAELTEFDLPLRPHGTPFQLRVWSALRDIPYGETTSYGVIATRLGSPTASRAVGLANGRNPISIIVPCHRVIGSTGQLVGYGGGLDRKRFLLALEARRAAPMLDVPI